MITKELSSTLGLDSSNVSKYKNQLLKRGVIHQGIALNHQNLKLAVYGLFSEYPVSLGVDLHPILSKSPFFHFVYTENIGCNSSLACFLRVIQ
ncbi:MAG: hypothetical protein KAU62_05150 [Candidatus Heimdallarchaeota archaeon]|nr:hypothetical protein [Candidatus Heimdallarchaeota archaeon]MCK4610526.1 hypothetical protein [Candidatus Heimdallarchaeota archaeon]